MTSLSDFPPDVQRAAAVVVFQFETDIQAGKFANTHGNDASQALIAAVAGAIMADRAGRLPVTGLTQRQADCLRFIADYQSNHGGVSPTYDEIAPHLGCGKSGVAKTVSQLEERGRITRLPTKARAITIIPTPAS